MPHTARAKIRTEAKIMREQGETLILFLFTETAADDDSTPLSISAADEPPNLALADQLPIYARVAWDVSEAVSFGVGGRTRTRKATIDTSVQYANLIETCNYFQVEDGTIMRKLSERISDDRVTYIIKCESYLGSPD